MLSLHLRGSRVSHYQRDLQTEEKTMSKVTIDDKEGFLNKIFTSEKTLSPTKRAYLHYNQKLIKYE